MLDIEKSRNFQEIKKKSVNRFLDWMFSQQKQTITGSQKNMFSAAISLSYSAYKT